MNKAKILESLKKRPGQLESLNKKGEILRVSKVIGQDS